MSKQFNLTLDYDDAGQLLDGLRLREEAWEKTAHYLRDGYFRDEPHPCEDCSDPDEAAAVAAHYRRIVTSIERQIEEQGGWGD